MKFLPKNEIKKTILVISDLHLSAGASVGKRKNFLEDFHYDKELIEFIEYYGSMHYQDRSVELIINGDFVDLLAVPFVKYFDDEFWSEEAALCKLKMIVDAHGEVFASLKNFLTFPNNRLVYIIGNHDSELILPALKEYLIDLFPKEDQYKFQILDNFETTYIPEPGIVIKHGHEYELAHHFHPEKSISIDSSGRKYFIPPWGSYYVIRVVNKFKEERDYINAVRPINKFIINGIIYDSLYTLRFLLSNIFYFWMVRFVMIFKQKRSLVEVWENVKNEMQLFKNYEELTEEYVTTQSSVHAFIVGHTHCPVFREYDDGSIFINTGTWTKMYNLDFGKNYHGARLTFAKIDVSDKLEENGAFEHLDVTLNQWKGKSDLPFKEFRY